MSDTTACSKHLHGGRNFICNWSPTTYHADHLGLLQVVVYILLLYHGIPSGIYGRQ